MSSPFLTIYLFLFSFCVFVSPLFFPISSLFIQHLIFSWLSLSPRFFSYFLSWHLMSFYFILLFIWTSFIYILVISVSSLLFTSFSHNLFFLPALSFCLCFLMSSLFFIISLFLDFHHLLAFPHIFRLSTSFCSKELLLLWLQFPLVIIYFIFHLILCIFSLLFALYLISSLLFMSSHLLFTFILITSLSLLLSHLASPHLFSSCLNWSSPWPPLGLAPQASHFTDRQLQTALYLSCHVVWHVTDYLPVVSTVIYVCVCVFVS